jgi:hypothetical protein
MREHARPSRSRSPLDVVRPSAAFAVPPTASHHDARRWLRLAFLAFLAVVGAAALLAVLGATAGARP